MNKAAKVSSDVNKTVSEGPAQSEVSRGTEREEATEGLLCFISS